MGKKAVWSIVVIERHGDKPQRRPRRALALLHRAGPAPRARARAEHRGHAHERQGKSRSIYESLIQAKEQSGAENQVLLRFAILQLIIPDLGGEWEITSTGEKGTEVTVEFLVDATGK